jgi:hypothetical protein
MGFVIAFLDFLLLKINEVPFSKFTQSSRKTNQVKSVILSDYKTVALS